MEYRKCFVPTCCNNSSNSPNKIFVRIREDLREKWCRDVGVEYCKVYTMYCCEDHFDPKKDLKNYYQHKLINQKPCLKPTATLRYIAPNKSEDSTELTKLLLHHASTCKPVKRKYEDTIIPSKSSYSIIPVKVCRVCLAFDVKMYDLKDIELKEMFQNITGITVPENNHSILERLCWECAGRLKAAAAFRNKALLSDALLQGLASTGEQIRQNDITVIKENQDYLKSAGTLSVVEVFHTVEIGTENEGVPSTSENNDTEIVQNTVRKDSIELEESIIEENNYVMDVADESMIEAPIKTESEYDHIPPNIADENRNIFLQIKPLISDNIHLREDTINSANSSPQPSGSHVEPKYPILGYLLKTPSNCKDKIKKPEIKITKRDSISKIVLKKSDAVISHHTSKGDAKLSNKNVKVGGSSKKTSNLKLMKKTQVMANTLTDTELLSFKPSSNFSGS